MVPEAAVGTSKNLAGLFGGLQSGLSGAVNETEVRDRFCRELYLHYGVDFRLERDRSDARLNRVLMEFKDLGLFNGRPGSAKFQEAYSQLTSKDLPEQAARDGLPLHSYIGVAIDGRHYAFAFFEESGTHRHTALLPIDPNSLYPLVEAIQRDARRPFTTENLVEDFGPGSVIAKEVARELWNHLTVCLTKLRGSRKVQMLFQEWRKLFAQATSLGRVGKTRIDDYLLSIGLTRPLDYTKALFALHTYNALLFKLIAAELVCATRYSEYSGFASDAYGRPTDALRDLLNSRIEHAEVFVSNNIENFIEGTFFSWYVENPPPSLLDAVRRCWRGWVYTFFRPLATRVCKTS